MEPKKEISAMSANGAALGTLLGLEGEDYQNFQALHSARYLLEDLNNPEGMEDMVKLTGLPMGVIVEAFKNIFAGCEGQ